MSAAITQLTERNARLEERARKEREGSKHTMGLVIGFGAALASAAASGYADGRWDLTEKDQVSGDGVRVMGMPVIPLVSVGTALAGLVVGGNMGQHLMFSALGTACQSVGGLTANAGRKAYQKSLTSG